MIRTRRLPAGTVPYIGRKNEISEEEELKIEVTVRGEKPDEMIKAVKDVHPCEKPVSNVIESYRTGFS